MDQKAKPKWAVYLKNPIKTPSGAETSVLYCDLTHSDSLSGAFLLLMLDGYCIGRVANDNVAAVLDVTMFLAPSDRGSIGILSDTKN